MASKSQCLLLFFAIFAITSAASSQSEDSMTDENQPVYLSLANLEVGDEQILVSLDQIGKYFFQASSPLRTIKSALIFIDGQSHGKANVGASFEKRIGLQARNCNKSVEEFLKLFEKKITDLNEIVVKLPLNIRDGLNMSSKSNYSGISNKFFVGIFRKSLAMEKNCEKITLQVNSLFDKTTKFINTRFTKYEDFLASPQDYFASQLDELELLSTAEELVDSPRLEILSARIEALIPIVYKDKSQKLTHDKTSFYLEKMTALQKTTRKEENKDDQARFESRVKFYAKIAQAFIREFIKSATAEEIYNLLTIYSNSLAFNVNDYFINKFYEEFIRSDFTLSERFPLSEDKTNSEILNAMMRLNALSQFPDGKKWPDKNLRIIAENFESFTSLSPQHLFAIDFFNCIMLSSMLVKSENYEVTMFIYSELYEFSIANPSVNVTADVMSNSFDSYLCERFAKSTNTLDRIFLILLRIDNYLIFQHRMEWITIKVEDEFINDLRKIKLGKEFDFIFDFLSMIMRNTGRQVDIEETDFDEIEQDASHEEIDLSSFDSPTLQKVLNSEGKTKIMTAAVALLKNGYILGHPQSGIKLI
jgi:hypothetical protein